MESHRIENIEVIPEKRGFCEYTKVSCPVRYGCFSEIQTRHYTFQFNLNGEIKFIQGRGRDWPHPAEWLKRTAGNDWLYYSTGSYNGIFDLIGEYYYPCLPYRSNSLFDGYGIDEAVKNGALQAWGRLHTELSRRGSGSGCGALGACVARIVRNDASSLKRRSRQYRQAIGERVSVLPPDTRHVDYETIPVIVADGCRYRCGFCGVKSSQAFQPRSRKSIRHQIEHLRAIHGRDLCNYNSIFIGQHDALMADSEAIEFAAIEAHQRFEFAKSNLKIPRLFLFGSVDSLIHSKESTFTMLNRLPFRTYLNVGLESGDPATLRILKKPVSGQSVKDAFARVVEINRRFEQIEISVNFVLGDNLPAGHLPSVLELVRYGLDRFCSKGAVYLSPLIGSCGRRELLSQFYRIKRLSRRPVYLYLIQRL